MTLTDQRDTALRLTPTQHRVLTSMANGHTRAATGKQLHLAENTVAKHLETIRQRLGARNTAHAVAIAVAAGLVEVTT